MCKILYLSLFLVRSTGLDLNLQQRFRWVHFPLKNEPIKNLLGRHLLRSMLHTTGGKIPSAEDPLFKVCLFNSQYLMIGGLLS